MPLSEPAPGRERLHERRIEGAGYRRADGLFDIEGRLTDVKGYAFDNRFRGAIPPGEPLHDMALRLTVDDRFLIHAVEATGDYGPFADCAGASVNYEKLVGETIGAGFNRRASKLIGGPAGCTHITELLGRLATVAFQTIYPLRERTADDGEPADPNKRPALLDSCVAFRAGGPVARAKWPDCHAAAASPAAAAPARK